MMRPFILLLLLSAFFLSSGCVMPFSSPPEETSPTPVPVAVVPAPTPTPTPNTTPNQSILALGAVSSDETKTDLLNMLSRVNSSDLWVRYQSTYQTDPPLPSSVWAIYRKENLSRTDIATEGTITNIYTNDSDTSLCTQTASVWTCANSSAEIAGAKTVDLDLPYFLSSLSGNFTMTADQTFFGIRCSCYRIIGGEDFSLHELTITPNISDICLSPQGVILYSSMSAQADGGKFIYTLSALNYSLKAEESDFILPAELATPARPHMEMVFYSLGMGDATLLKADNVTMLIDTGSDATAESLAKSILQRDISKIDVLLISSWDVNKLGGLESIFKRFTVSEIWVPGDPPDNRVFIYPWTVMHQVAVPIRNVSAGDNFNFSSVSVEIFNPPKVQFSQSPDANSVVMRVWYDNFCAFLPGDIENEQHALIVGKVGSRHCDVYKWPYHGRGSPQASLLFDRFQPSNTVISVGTNDLSLPSYTTLERLRISNTKVWRTDTDGDIYIHVEKGGSFNISANSSAE